MNGILLLVGPGFGGVGGSGGSSPLKYSYQYVACVLLFG